MALAPTVPIQLLLLFYNSFRKVPSPEKTYHDRISTPLTKTIHKMFMQLTISNPTYFHCVEQIQDQRYLSKIKMNNKTNNTDHERNFNKLFLRPTIKVSVNSFSDNNNFSKLFTQPITNSVNCF